MVKQFDDWFTTRYGSRRGFLRASEHRLLGHLGRYQRYRRVDWARVGRLVFVCKGNICRSAFAEAVARQLGVDAISCGLEAITGAPANSQAIEVAANRGFDLGAHQSRPLSSLSPAPTDLLVAMEPRQACQVESLLPGANCTLLGLWGSPSLPYIHDPYGALDAYFERCFSYIEKSVDEIAAQISRSRS